MNVNRIPVRLRLSLGHAVWMALLFAGLGFGLYRVVQHNLYQSVDAALLASARSINEARFIRGFNSPLMEEFLARYFGERYIRPYAQLVDLSGKVSAKTGNIRVSLPVTPLAVANAEIGVETFETFKRSGKAMPFRQVTLPVIAQGKFTGELIQVGAPLDGTIHSLREIALVLWIALPLGLAVSVVFGYKLTKHAFKPVNNIRLAAAGLGANDLGVRLQLPPAKDELRELAGSFNAMLDRLEDAFKRLRCFSGDVSHELRTPIAVLRAEAELALRRDRTPEEYRAALRNIVQESTTMTAIVEDLLLLARAESRALAMKWEDVETKNFVQSLIESMTPVFAKRQIQLEGPTHFSENTFRASPGYLNIVLKNILLNAAKHSAPGSPVMLDVEQKYGEIIFRVTDKGEGIPAESIPYIFDPFYRADTARNRAAGGAGVGLSLAMALVRLHNGSIEVTSSVGVGSTFTVRIPEPGFDSKTSPTLTVKKSKESLPVAAVPQPS